MNIESAVDKLEHQFFQKKSTLTYLLQKEIKIAKTKVLTGQSICQNDKICQLAK